MILRGSKMRSTTLSKKIFYRLLRISFVTISLVSVLWLIYMDINYNEDVKALRENYTQEQKRIVSNSVDQMVKHVTHKVDRAHVELKKELKEDVLNSYRIITAIYDRYKETLTNTEIVEIIKQALREVRFGDDDRSVVLNSLDGVSILCSEMPHLEGRLLSKIKTVDGSSMIQRQLDLIRSKEEGLIRTSWSDVDDEGDELKRSRLSYVKAMPELALLISVGTYLDDFEKKIKKEMIDIISRLRYGKNGYFWVNDFTPVMIVHPILPSLNGQELSEYTDPYGNDLFNKMVRQCRDDGEGFVTYHWLKPATDKITPKLSFVKAYERWDWIIGSGIYLDEIENDILEKKEILKEDIMNVLIFSLLLNLLLTYVLYRIFSNLHKEIDTSFQEFYQFMENAFNTSNILDIKKFKFDEFRRLAQYTNTMIDQRLHYEKEILTFNENLEAQVQERSKDLETTQKQLVESEKMASLGGLVAGVAHEINTPVGVGLTGITHLQELNKKIIRAYEAKDMGQEDFELYLERTDETAQIVTVNLMKAASLINSFKQVAVDQSSEEKRTFDLDEYIKEILLSINNVIKKTRHTITVECPRSLTITSYPGAISQILTNLIMNSIVHAYSKEDKGEIHIDVADEDDHIRLVYEDDGKGIKKEDLAKVCDPFFTTNRAHGGSGLGMNIVYNIVHTRLKGSMQIESEKHHGVKMTFILPKLKE